MADVRSRATKDGKAIIVRDVAPRHAKDYVTITELIDHLRHAIGRGFLPETILYWIYNGTLEAHKAGDGRTAAWLIHRDTARRFVEHMRQRHGGELIGSVEACAILGQLIGREGPVSHNTLTTWRRNGLIYPAVPGMNTAKYTRGELEDFAAWFNRVRVWRFGQWAVPTKAQRRFWVDAEAGEPVEVGKYD